MGCFGLFGSQKVGKSIVELVSVFVSSGSSMNNRIS